MKRLFIITALLTSSSAWGQVASLDDQAKCAKQAEQVFDSDRTDFKVNNPELQMSFTSHYNPKLGRCFVEISAVPGGSRVNHMSTVYVAFERAVFASYWAVQNTNQNQSDTLLSCAVGEAHCHSRAEFEALVLAQYGLASNQ
jgi:hypothetical protein